MTVRRILLSFGLLVGALFQHGAAAETVEKLPAPTAYVSDFAGVIDEASRQQIEALCVQVNSQAHAQIAVVTVRSLEGEEASEFANKLFAKWKVGTGASDAKGRDRGVLLLFAIEDRKRWIEVGYGLEGVLNDAKVGDIGRSMKPQLAAGQYGPAIQGGVVQMATAIAADAGVTITPPQSARVYRSQPQERSKPGIGSILKVLIFLAIVVFVIGRGGGGGGLLWFLAGSMLSGGGRDRDSGFGGGGGDSGGGGFGGFGGGGSGGGGAGGDW